MTKEELSILMESVSGVMREYIQAATAPLIERLIALEAINEVTPIEGPPGKDGKPGAPGKDGTDGRGLTVEDFRAMFETERARWSIDFERYARAEMDRAIAKLPIPKDGKDGRDGLGFEDMTADYDGERCLTLRFTRAELERVKTLYLPIPIERGVWRAGVKYERGDGVTYGGSYWLAQLNGTTSRPGEDATWRLAIKRGRDGRDGGKHP